MCAWLHVRPTARLMSDSSPRACAAIPLLQALFRPITVVVPDRQLIMENMLMAEGFVTGAGAGAW